MRQPKDFLPYIKKHLVNAKQRAKQKGFEFNLKEEDIVIPSKCPILDIPLYYTKNKISMNTPTVDRIDNDKGYIKENIQVISELANRMKTSANKEQLLKFAFWVYRTYL